MPRTRETINMTSIGTGVGRRRLDEQIGPISSAVGRPSKSQGGNSSSDAGSSRHQHVDTAHRTSGAGPALGRSAGIFPLHPVSEFFLPPWQMYRHRTQSYGHPVPIARQVRINGRGDTDPPTTAMDFFQCTVGTPAIPARPDGCGRDTVPVRRGHPACPDVD